MGNEFSLTMLWAKSMTAARRRLRSRAMADLVATMPAPMHPYIPACTAVKYNLKKRTETEWVESNYTHVNTKSLYFRPEMYRYLD